MRAHSTWLVVVLCLTVTPGLCEVLSDGFHFLSSGHTHHAEGHEEPDPEHGCTGAQHNCFCCTSLSFAPAGAVVGVPSARLAATGTAPLLDECGPVGVRTTIERPPRA